MAYRNTYLRIHTAGYVSHWVYETAQAAFKEESRRRSHETAQQGKKRLLLRHSQFYNTEPQVGTIINGIVASMEEGIALGDPIPEEMPTSVKTALMGPLAGIGDSIIQGIFVPTLLSIGMSLAANGSVAGPIFYIVTWLICGLAISYGLFRYGYNEPAQIHAGNVRRKNEWQNSSPLSRTAEAKP